MRALVVLIVIVGAMALLGWLAFSRMDGDPQITIKTEKIEEDLGRAAEAGRDAVDKAAKKVEQFDDELRENDSQGAP